MDKSEATAYLTSLLHKTLRVTTSDARMFLGQFRCTDSDLNIILTSTFEYRNASSPNPTSRYLGQVVVPGSHVVKIEVEEFVSQMKGAA
ncbi:hypothetical protein M430DRAFT_77564, partial [Amorphotheca resinae ATCC 22711]